MTTDRCHVGDCRDVMRAMPDNSVDAIVTDPPYGLRFMNKHWDYDVPGVDVWAECLRVLKPGGYLLAFAGTRTQHRMAVRIEDAGFEIRDMIAWVYGSGFPKHRSALKPALEPITLARKPAKVATLLNIDACRIGDEIVGWSGDAAGGVTWTSENCGLSKGGEERPVAGRYPANLIHDGCDEVLACFPDAPGQIAKASTNDTQRASKNVYGVMARGSNRQEPRNDVGSAARFFYCAKASKADRDAGLDGFEKRSAGMVSNTSGQHLTRREEGYEVAARANHHPTVKPTELMRYLCRLITPAGGTVLDPFMGSGSTGRGAVLEGLQFIGIEREAEYADIARARIAHAAEEYANSTRQRGLELVA